MRLLFTSIITIALTLALVACQPATEEPASAAPEPKAQPVPEAQEESTSPNAVLTAVLAAQDDAVKGRYEYRNPQETLEFFGIEPGMTIVEGLPGRGWYTKILLPYLGENGCLIGANYSIDMWPLFPFGTEEFVAGMSTWTTDFPNNAQEWGGETGAEIHAFEFGSMPEDFKGAADVVLFARVLHNLANFQNAGKGDYLSKALADAHAALKPGGVFGVVQHEASESMSAEFASGSRGYLKRAWLVEQVENAGFEFVAASEINANPKDQPNEDDIVWRLPPSYNGTAEDPELKAAVDAIGESNRMTLKFVKSE